MSRKESLRSVYIKFSHGYGTDRKISSSDNFSKYDIRFFLHGPQFGSKLEKDSCEASPTIGHAIKSLSLFKADFHSVQFS